ncbi:MAG TPA: MFS transporter [Stellaceae bacterium]|nr:MFS transporter [Stellaceae bacterium]
MIRSRVALVGGLGITQLLAWGSTYYLLSVLAPTIAAENGWSLSSVIGGLSAGLLASGLVSPFIGRRIERHGGRAVLAGGALLLALGLAALGLARSFPAFILAWLVIGIGMGASLYDPAFATLGRLYGAKARTAITIITFFGGLSSTVCWPLSAGLLAEVGWRGTCFTYAAIELCFAFPIFLLVVPPAPAPASPLEEGRRAAPPTRPALFALVAGALTLGSVIASVLSLHALTLMERLNVAVPTAVALGTIVGPSQVIARILEITFGRRFHPVATMLVSAILVSAAMPLLLWGVPGLVMGLILYGGGNGLLAIARGTLPLALFGVTGYAVRLGRIARWSLLAQSLSPWLAALLLDHAGANALILALAGIALIEAAASFLLVRPAWRR